MKSLFDRYKKELKELHDSSCERKLCSFKKAGKYIFEDNKKYLNLSSNDYLELQRIKRFLTGSSKLQIFLSVQLHQDCSPAALMFMQSSSAFLRLCFARTKHLFLTAVIMPMWV